MVKMPPMPKPIRRTQRVIPQPQSWLWSSQHNPWRLRQRRRLDSWCYHKSLVTLNLVYLFTKRWRPWNIGLEGISLGRFSLLCEKTLSLPEGDRSLKRTLLTTNDARLLGAVTMQAFHYFSKFLKDPLWTKALVRSLDTV